MTSSRLSESDWTDAATAVLQDEGAAALTINRLCTRLSVTRGSFYWHFSDLEDLHRAVGRRWCETVREAQLAVRDLEPLPAQERLRAMTLGLIAEPSARVERALRTWARTDPVVAEVLSEADVAVLEAVQATLEELGHPAAQARILAGLLVYAGIGFSHGGGGLPQPTEVEVDQLVQLLLP